MQNELLHTRIRGLIASGSDINQIDEQEYTLLLEAIENDDVSAVNLLIKNNADVNFDSGYFGTPLDYVVTNTNSVQMAELLISNGADVNRLDDYGTPLHGAATGDKESLAQFLIDHGADVCASDGDQLRTPLHIAARNGSVYVLRLLIKNGADVNARDDDRNTPLHYAAESEYTKKSKHAWMSKHTRQVVEELMKNGADVNAANVTGDTPLHLAARTGAAPVENIEELVELAELFISNGADVNAANDLEGTPLHIASHNSAIFVARLLIKNGADVNARDYAGKTPLHYAAESEITGIGKHAFKIASELLKNGANVNAQDNMGDTPLHLAASVGETIIVKKLVDSGADVDLRNSVDQKPEDRILENGLGRSVETHIRAGIPQWIVILSRKRKQLIVIDDYGIVDKSKWRDELKYFVNKVLLQKEGGFNDPHRQWLLNNGKSIGLLIDCVDNAVDDWEEFRKEQTAYQETSYKEDMDPIVYEYLCANLLAAGGWQTKVTAASSDQGVDVFAQSNGISVVLQCKKSSTPVGNKAVQEAHAGKGFMDADYAIVVSNNSFTPSAKQLASTLGILLLHHDQLHDLYRLIHTKKN